MLRLNDTATGEVRPLAAGAGQLGMYICGPTVYGPPHIGHGRFTLVYDVLRRYLESSGTSVRHVSNITDIDDKIIERAANEKRDWSDLAAESEARWWAAMDTMGVLRPHETPHATDYIDQMVELISELVAKKAAYEVDDGVYLSVDKVPGYGLLALQPLSSLRAGARVEVSSKKISPLDFALWKKAKENEPSWPSPFGAGRPGWHTECVVMALDLLGEGFELHGGGTDLQFPHHENERAQAVAVGRQFARHWCHNGMVVSGGEKMSKSLGNTTDLAGLLSSYDPRAYRLLVLQAHYRAPMEVSPEQFAAASQALERLDSLARRLGELPSKQSGDPPAPSQLEAAFSERMDDDLDTPRAMALVFDAVRSANALLARGDGEGGGALGRQALDCALILGLSAETAGEVSPEAEELAHRRDQARAAKDWAGADSLRDELVRLGYRVEDSPAGTRLYRE